MARAWFRIETNKAKHSKFSSYQHRLASFKYWPTSKTQTKEQLAEAGFFHINKDVELNSPSNDFVRCFYCDLGLSDWKNEDPWKLHAVLKPNCFYLLQVKNQDLAKIQQISTETQPSQDIEATKSTVEENSASNSEISNICSDVESISNAISALSVKDESDTTKSSHVETNSSTSSKFKSLLCQICNKEPRDTLFIPCHHLISCNKCAEMLEDKCSKCLKYITHTWSVQLV